MEEEASRKLNGSKIIRRWKKKDQRECESSSFRRVANQIYNEKSRKVDSEKSPI